MKSLLFIACLMLTAIPALAQEPLRSVQVEPVQHSTQPTPVEVAGVLNRMAELNLAFPVAGIVGDVQVRAGDTVTKGQPLASLKLDEVEAQLKQAEAAREKAQRDLKRAESLLASAVISTEEVQNARTALAQTTAQTEVTEFLRRHAALEAPANGRILRRLAEPDQTVAAGQPVLGFADDQSGWLVRAALSARDVMRIAPGDRATVIPSGAADATFTAIVSRISAGSDELTHTVEVELTPDSPLDVRLRSGFVVRVIIQPSPGPERAHVTASSLVEGQGRAAHLFLLREEDSTVQRVEVLVDELSGARAFLSTPLPAGAKVVTRGAEFLRDRESVEVVESP